MEIKFYNFSGHPKTNFAQSTNEISHRMLSEGFFIARKKVESSEINANPPTFLIRWN